MLVLYVNAIHRGISECTFVGRLDVSYLMLFFTRG